MVVGAGAAGLVAAAEAALCGARPLLLEKSRKPGLKILISGGGHCNVTTTLSPEAAEPLFGARGGRFLRAALRTTPPATVRGWLAERGVPTVEGELEKVWPRSRRAQDVLDALVGRATGAGVELRLEMPVLGLTPPAAADGSWCVDTPAGQLAAPSLVLATGGLSYPRTGTTGDGYTWLEALGLRLRPRVPALAPLRSPAAWVHELAGVTLDDVEVQLRDAAGRVVWRRRRPCLFTHFGLSGPGPMDASSRLEQEPGRWRLCLGLCPDRPAEALAPLLFAGTGRLVPTLQRALSLPRRLCEHLIAKHGLLDTPPAQVPATKRRDLLVDLEGLPVPIDGSTGFAHAELTAGGLELDQVDPRTMEVRGRPGLFVTGELLDVDGPIGGFSFLAAFGTGVLAGRAAAARARALAPA